MTSTDRRRVVSAALGGALSLTLVHGSRAQSPYPNQSIRMVVPWPPGGLTDAVGRMVAQSLTERLGQTVYVDNRPGASGNIGTAQFAHLRADGYSLLLGSSTAHAANPHLFKQLGFDPIKDFAPIGLIATAPNVLLVPAASPYRDVRQLVAAAKANPNGLTYGSAGPASSGHLAGALFAKIFDVQILHVPYRGAGPALVDLMADHITMMFDPSALQHVRSGKLRALAVPASKRLPAMPDVPTFEEAMGTKDMQASAWYGLMVPAGTPAEIVDTLARALDHALQSNEIRDQLYNAGAAIASPGTPQEFGKFMQSELERYGVIVKLSGAQAE